jgi:hypothetical protein
MMKLFGGCLCGDIRYLIDKDPIDAGFCHCKICQRANGAPTVAWLTIPVVNLNYTGGSVSIFSSSGLYQREFCGRCGTHIAFRAKHDAKTVDVTLCSLDDSSQIKPQYHIWCQSKVNWLHINDELPKYIDSGPDSP